MTKKNLPHIPLYVGDWKKDCNVLSLSAEAAWLNIIFILHTKGKQSTIKMPTKALQNLWRCSLEDVKEILEELESNEICDLQTTEGFVEFTCRRYLKENELSEIRSAARKSGYTKNKTSTNNQQNKNKTLQIADNDNDNDNDIDIDYDNKYRIPSEIEFLEYGLFIIKKEKLKGDYEFTLKAKYHTWLDENWKNGHGKKIKNWKNTLNNTIPHLKPMNNGRTKNNEHEQYRRELLSKIQSK